MGIIDIKKIKETPVCWNCTNADIDRSGFEDDAFAPPRREGICTAAVVGSSIFVEGSRETLDVIINHEITSQTPCNVLINGQKTFKTRA